MKAKQIWLTILPLCTFGSAAIGAIPQWNHDGGCMMPAPAPAILFGIVCGVGGFLVSLVLAPVAVITDQGIRDHRLKTDYQRSRAQDSAQSLLRASAPSLTQQQAELLRAAPTGLETPKEQMLRIAQEDS